MKPILIHLRPLDQAANARVDIRAGDGPSANTYGAGGLVWHPAVAQRPVFTQELMNASMDGKVQVGEARFALNLKQISAAAQRYYYRGAECTIWYGDGLTGKPAFFTGLISQESFNQDTGLLTLQAQVSVVFIDRNLLTKVFSGGGGIGGDAERRGVFLPAGFGFMENIQPVWFDLTDNIGMIDGYGNTLSIDWLAEGLNSWGAPVDNYANYAALKAAIVAGTIKAGQWGMVAQPGQPGLIGLGAPAAGIVTCHATFGGGTVGAMMRRIMEVNAGVPVERIDTEAFDLLDSIVDYPQRYWTSEQRNVKDLLEKLAGSVNASPIVGFDNRITVKRAVRSAAVAVLDKSGAQEPRVLDWQHASPDAPYFRLAARAAKPGVVLSFDQVLYADDITDRGLYNSTTVYYQGNTVWLQDNSLWLYINEEATAGNAPPDAAGADPDDVVQNDYWFRLKPASTADDIRFDGGTGPSVQDLKPAEPGATNTADPNSAIGGRTVAEVEADLTQAVEDAAEAIAAASQLAVDLLESQILADIRQAALEDLTHIGDEEAKTYLQTRVDAFGYLTEDGSAMVINGATVWLQPDGTTLVGQLSQIESSIGDITEPGGTIDARITEYDEVLTSPTGAIAQQVDDVRTEYIDDINSAITRIYNSQSNNNSVRAAALLELEANYGTGARAAAEDLYEAVIGPTGVNAQAISQVSVDLSDLDAATAASLAALGLDIDDVNASVTDIRQVLIDPDGTVTAKAVIALDVNDRVTGMYLTADQTVSQIEMLFDSYNFLTPTGGSIFYAVGSTVYMPDVVVDTLSVNTAIVPKRATASTPTYGNGDPADTTSTFTPFTVLSTTITLPVAGVIDVTGTGVLGYTGGDSQYQAQIFIDGVQPLEGVTGNGFGARDGGFVITGSRHRPAGTYTIQLRFNGNTNLMITQRALKCYGYPATELT